MPRKSVLKIGLILLFTSILGITLYADETVEINFEMTSARSAAMGGRHVALADDLTVLFNNPAGFRSVGPEFLVAELTFGLSGPIFDITSAIIEGGLSQDLVETLQYHYAAMNLIGPLSFGYVGNGFGFGISSGTSVRFNTGFVTVKAEIVEKLIFAGGYTFRLPVPDSWNSTFDMGILLKAFSNAKTTVEDDIASLIDAFSDPFGLIYSEPFQLSLGAGFDLGLLYNYKERFSVGLVSRDLFTPILIYNYGSFQDYLDSKDRTKSNELLPIDLSVGILYKPPLGRLARYISDLKLMLDYEDILDFLTHPETSSNPVLHVGMGVEFILLEILSIRSGFRQGLLSAGLGFDLSILTINLAVFGTELSPDPGLRSVFNIMLGIEFKL